MTKAVFHVDTVSLLCLNKACSSPYGQALTYPKLLKSVSVCLSVTSPDNLSAVPALNI